MLTTRPEELDIEDATPTDGPDDGPDGLADELLDGLVDDLPRPVRVGLSNDYEIALLGLAQMLARHPEQVQVVALTSGLELPEEVDVILYDTFGRLPDHDEKLRRVVADNKAKVVVYSWDDYPEDAARRHGAAGYLHKGLGADELVSAIVAIHDRDHGVPVPAAEEPAQDAGGAGGEAGGGRESTQTWPGQEHGLSERESEMLSFITRGLTNEEIGRRAFLSINTVKTYIRTAYRKIGVHNRAQAVVWGYQHGFQSISDIEP